MQEEGLRLKPYTDTVGKVTIGYGRNLTDKGITEIEAIDLLRHDVEETLSMLPYAIPYLLTMNEVRQRILADMAFNMGISTLLTFKKMLTYVKLSEYDLAANEMENSTWYRQTGVRAAKLTKMMRTGKDL